jgi:hypothetical protein
MKYTFMGTPRVGFAHPFILEDLCKSPSAVGRVGKLNFLVYRGERLAPSAERELV